MASVQRSGKRQRWIAIGVAVCASAVLLPLPVVRSAPVPIVQPVATTAVTQAGLSQAPPSSKRRGLARVDLYPLPSPGTNARSREDDLELHLFPDVTIRAVFERFDTVGGSGTWVGHVDGVPMSAVALAYRDGLLTGSINTVDHLYDIQPVRDADRDEALHVVAEIDLAAMPTGHDIASPQDAVGPPEVVEAPVAADNDVTIDLLAVYTPSAVALLGSQVATENFIALGVANTNAAYARSGITQRLNLVRAAPVPYAEANKSFQAIADLREGREGLSGVAAMRDATGADLVMLLADLTGFPFAGVAYQSTEPGQGRPDLGFSVVCANSGAYCTSVAFPHELGHNMGAAHDWFEGARSAFAFAYGHIDPVQRVATLMSYLSSCQAQGFACQYIPYFSSPETEFIPFCSGTSFNCDLLRSWLYPRSFIGMSEAGGSSCRPGVASPVPCWADNRRLHNTTASTVASYRQRRF